MAQKTLLKMYFYYCVECFSLACSLHCLFDMSICANIRIAKAEQGIWIYMQPLLPLPQSMSIDVRNAGGNRCSPAGDFRPKLAEGGKKATLCGTLAARR
jgi:hypothetical protein